MRRTTIRDVAALAGVSPATVSRALDDRPEIRPETRERVREACRQLGYVPTPPPRAWRARPPMCWALWCRTCPIPTSRASPTPSRRRRRRTGYRVLLSNSLQEEERELQAIENLWPAGSTGW